jgi:hypothetical protein
LKFVRKIVLCRLDRHKCLHKARTRLSQFEHKLCSTSKVSTTPAKNTKHTWSRQLLSRLPLSPESVLSLTISLNSLLSTSPSTKTPNYPSIQSRAQLNPQSKSTTPRPHQTTTMFSFLQNPRQAAAQILNFALIMSTAGMMWKGISVLADSPSPIVVVLSGSMEPAFQRGDLLFLWNRNFFEETKVGEIVVYNVKGKDIPIVHRLVRKFGTG